MRGRMRRRSANSWELTIDLGRDPQGRRLRKFVSVKGQKKDALRSRNGHKNGRGPRQLTMEVPLVSTNGDEPEESEEPDEPAEGEE